MLGLPLAPKQMLGRARIGPGSQDPGHPQQGFGTAARVWPEQGTGSVIKPVPLSLSELCRGGNVINRMLEIAMS